MEDALDLRMWDMTQAELQRLPSQIEEVERHISDVEQKLAQAGQKIRELGGPGEGADVGYWKQMHTCFQDQREALREQKEILLKSGELLQEHKLFLLEEQGRRARNQAGKGAEVTDTREGGAAVTVEQARAAVADDWNPFAALPLPQPLKATAQRWGRWFTRGLACAPPEQEEALQSKKTD